MPQLEDQRTRITEEQAKTPVLQRILNHGGRPPFTLDQTTRFLGVPIDRVKAMVEDGSLVALPVGDADMIPSWQFHTDRPEASEEVTAIASLFPNDAWGIAGMITRSQPGLGNKVPVDELRSEDPDRVARALRFSKALVEDIYGLEAQ